jgi:triosephosphate isomerase
MNPSRKPLIAGNWKMFKGGPAGVELAMACGKLARDVPHVDLLIAPPFTVLAAVAHDSADGGVLLAGQNMHAKDSGAYTGEISGVMLKESGCTWVILGHSERRQFFGDTDALVADKTVAALRDGLSPIVCVGETLKEREAGDTLKVVERQVGAVLEPLLGAKIPVAIAYEPVWAIGTGKNAGPAEAEEVHLAIRRQLEVKAHDLAKTTRILYGGSVKPDNAQALLGCLNVDGALIGGASLDAGSFGAIARAAEALARAF